MGPLPNPNAKAEILKEHFPSYHRTKPIVLFKEPIDENYMSASLHVFRSAPSTKNKEDYIARLDKVESKKAPIWKEQGLYDLIQLSRVDHPYFQNMLVETLYFWKGTTNTFQLPCGMIIPTLFDVTAITGLCPTG